MKCFPTKEEELIVGETYQYAWPIEKYSETFNIFNGTLIERKGEGLNFKVTQVKDSKKNIIIDNPDIVAKWYCSKWEPNHTPVLSCFLDYQEQYQLSQMHGNNLLDVRMKAVLGKGAAEEIQDLATTIIHANELNEIIDSYKSKHPLNIFNRPSSEITALRELVRVPMNNASFTLEDIAKCIESTGSYNSHERAQIIREGDSSQKPTSNGTDEVLMKIHTFLCTQIKEDVEVAKLLDL